MSPYRTNITDDEDEDGEKGRKKKNKTKIYFPRKSDLSLNNLLILLFLKAHCVTFENELLI